jgi:tetratricopeptide (TPR) repeat protein
MSRSMRIAAVLATLAGLLLPSISLACLWDYDTIKMERTRFPGTLELITGKFLRHSPEFYQWRIGNRLKRLESDPGNPALLDDLAAAYDKTGQHEKAIETALSTEKLHPGRYETAANLATFYFHSGKLKEGLPVIDKALKINPDAHFGREKYQKLFVEYLIEQRKSDPQKVPLSKVVTSTSKYRDTDGSERESEPFVTVGETFADFLCLGKSTVYLPPDESEAAIKGILGMMKFGRHDSPLLLEALGSLLAQRDANPTHDAKHLATRAYLKASYEIPEGPAREAYRKMAKKALDLQTGSQSTIERLEPAFKRELDEAQAWYSELRERELSWIREGKDPESEFDKLYEVEPEVSGMDVKDPMSPHERAMWAAIAFLLMFTAVVFAFGVAIRHFLRKRAALRLAASVES